MLQYTLYDIHLNSVLLRTCFIAADCYERALPQGAVLGDATKESSMREQQKETTALWTGAKGKPKPWSLISFESLESSIYSACAFFFFLFFIADVLTLSPITTDLGPIIMLQSFRRDDTAQVFVHSICAHCYIANDRYTSHRGVCRAVRYHCHRHLLLSSAIFILSACVWRGGAARDAPAQVCPFKI